MTSIDCWQSTGRYLTKRIHLLGWNWLQGSSRSQMHILNQKNLKYFRYKSIQMKLFLSALQEALFCTDTIQYNTKANVYIVNTEMCMSV